MPEEFCLVVDERKVNAETLKDRYALPLISEINQQQLNYKMWSGLDMLDGFYQKLLKKEHRHITFTSSSLGMMQSKVHVMGLKNASTQLQSIRGTNPPPSASRQAHINIGCKNRTYFD